GPITGSVEILAELRDRGTPLYGLTNFSAETYPPAFERFEFLRWFDGILVSGEVGLIKPDPRIFELLIDRFAIDPLRPVYLVDGARLQYARVRHHAAARKPRGRGRNQTAPCRSRRARAKADRRQFLRAGHDLAAWRAAAENPRPARRWRLSRLWPQDVCLDAR